jgi:hypothetical protein
VVAPSGGVVEVGVALGGVVDLPLGRSFKSGSEAGGWEVQLGCYAKK